MSQDYEVSYDLYSTRAGIKLDFKAISSHFLLLHKVMTPLSTVFTYLTFSPSGFPHTKQKNFPFLDFAILILLNGTYL